MDERFADLGNGITLCYEQLGDPADEPLLLVMGLGAQMLAWPDEFCRQLAGRGFFVTRYDNRDAGRSTKMSDKRPPSLTDLLLRRKSAAAYLLKDMADDAAGLLDALGIERAHVVGASMGGMIAQTFAARHPDRTRSLASIMSNTGALLTGLPSLPAMRYLASPPPKSVDAAVERSVSLFRLVGSPGFDRDEAEIRRLAYLGQERSGGDTAGAGRQLMAILASGDRTRELRRIEAPTVVIHGTNDRLVNPSGGRATAKAIPGAELVMVDGLGHDLPIGAWPLVLDPIERNARRTAAADAGRAVAA
ncbi:alpha/beta fold hydrolase [Conexibacter sp. SYSU D00693]|uniref:alpha/beta fold hydrolase n=1 Tax=Conexibacter sp. SYSU D00693 TaxID=2812560 RepID=UPI00196A35AE|nr:alpha/beta hydrolase [Conexibacter sp. SYSU D00693]